MQYGLYWPDKEKAAQEAQSPMTHKLVLDVLRSKNRDQAPENFFIEGENLEALKILQQDFQEKVKCIYIDPPYNTGKQFLYNDDYTQSTKDRHTLWLNMMYPRLLLAHQLLSSEGVLFISIGPQEQANLQLLCTEIFGEENLLANLVWENKEGGGGSDSKYFRIKHEYILVFAKNKKKCRIHGVPISNLARYTQKDAYLNTRGPYYLQKLNQASIQYARNLDYPIEAPDGTPLFPKQGEKRACWRWSKRKVEWGREHDFLVFKKDRKDKWQVYTKQYLLCNNKGEPIERKQPPTGVVSSFSTVQATKNLERILGPKIFPYSKPIPLIRYLLARVVAPKEKAIVVDFFAGSCTTAHACIEFNQHHDGNISWIMVQSPTLCPPSSPAFKAGFSNISSIGIHRIQKVLPEDSGFGVYTLSVIE